MTIAVVALVLVTAAFAMPVSKLRQASRVPRIHDITTDTERPPRFSQRRSAARGRAEDSDSSTNGGPRRRRATAPGIS